MVLQIPSSSARQVVEQDLRAGVFVFPDVVQGRGDLRGSFRFPQWGDAGHYSAAVARNEMPERFPP